MGSYSRISCTPCDTPRHTLPPYARPSARVTDGGCRRNDGTDPRFRRLLLSLLRIRLLLLSVFVSLFSIDDTTLHLVAHSPAHSALFPGPIRPSDEGTGYTLEFHGVHALLKPSRQHAGLRDGLAVACDESILLSNPFKISASTFIGLLGLVRGICVRVGPPCAE